MNIVKATGVIGGLTLVSRIFGFARDMLLSRILGAGLAADAFFVAFRLPNLFRRLFAEGAFSAAFVPMFSRHLHGPGGRAEGENFAAHVLAVFVPILLLFTALLEIFMPALVWLMASSYQDVPGKFELTVELTRIAFPYLMLVSIVSLLSGILNSLSRFAAAAAAPILLNICLIAGALAVQDTPIATAKSLAVAVTIAGLLQFFWLLWAVKRAGIDLRLRWPRLTPDVKQLGVVILPATFGAGIYQLSQLIDTFFVTQLPQGSMAYLNYADRLNQLPLGVIGIALGTAILPTLSRFITQKDEAQASRIQATAVELSMFLTVPAAFGLAVCAQPLVSAFYVGGKFSLADAAVTSGVLSALVAGLPAYVLIKVLTPGFFARGDTRTPVKTAATALTVNVGLILLLIEPYGIRGMAAATALSSWFNCALLYAILHRRGHFTLRWPVWRRLGGQLVAALMMAAILLLLRSAIDGWFAGPALSRIAGIIVLVGAGLPVYFGAAWLLGGFDRDLIANLRRRRAKA